MALCLINHKHHLSSYFFKLIVFTILIHVIGPVDLYMTNFAEDLHDALVVACIRWKCVPAGLGGGLIDFNAYPMLLA